MLLLTLQVIIFFQLIQVELNEKAVMAIEAILLGLIVGLIYFELFKVAPGGIFSPGYFACVLFTPIISLSAFLIVLVVLGVMALLSRIMFLFGRRALLAAMILSFIICRGADSIFDIYSGQPAIMLIIGYFVPGEVAHECRRQGTWRTVRALLIVTIIIKMILVLQFGFS